MRQSVMNLVSEKEKQYEEAGGMNRIQICIYTNRQ